MLGIQIVTDDQAMLTLAEAFGIETSTTLGLMRLMLDTEHIEMDVVRQICEYWQTSAIFQPIFGGTTRRFSGKIRLPRFSRQEQVDR